MALLANVKTAIRRDASDMVRLFRVTKYEWDALASHLAGRFSRRRLQTHSLRLNVASGGHRVPGWLNVDGIPGADVRVDLRRRWPMGDGCAEYIYCEHFLDHLEFPHGAEKFLHECLRVLEPGGRMRLVVHDLELIARAYLAKDRDFFQESGFEAATFAESVNQVARFNDFHRFMYDFDCLKQLLSKVGFTNVVRSAFRASEVQALNIDVDVPDRPVQSLYVEAIKPV